MNKDAWQKYIAILGRPVNGASLGVFRILLGMIMLLEAYSIGQPSQSAAGSVPLETYYTSPEIRIHFPYPAFEWLPLLSAGWIQALVALLALGSIFLAIGLFHRVAAATVFVTWAYLYAVESTRTYWMSYYYLELLLTFLLIWMPASRRYSVDALRARNEGAPREVPFWTLALLRGQLVIAYFYAGVAKLNADWLLDAQPVRYFLSQPHVAERLSGTFLEGWAQSTWLAYFVSYAGVAFDLAIGILLLVRRTRIFGIVLMAVFHGTNHFILFNDLVWFPMVGFATALIFLDPDWPERLARWIRKPGVARPDWKWLVAGGVMAPGVGLALGWKLPPSRNAGPQARAFGVSSGVAGLVAAWLAFQAVVPLRHYVIPGDGRFTFEGLAFSWRLKAEVYRSMPAEIFIEDSGIAATGADGVTRIAWERWNGERVLYHEIPMPDVKWRELPEVLVVYEPTIGERILYNPWAGVEVPRSESESRARVAAIWRELYGRAPGGVHRTVPLDQILEAYMLAMRRRGKVITDRQQAIAAIRQHHLQNGDGTMIPVLRRLVPFDGNGLPAVGSTPLWIEDPALARETSLRTMQVVRLAWRTGSATRGAVDAATEHEGGDPLTIYTAPLPFEVRRTLPEAIWVRKNAEPGVRVSWNYMEELTVSKGMHISMQPFLLRRYARHVADRWEKEHGRRPAVFANTALSLNFRPPEELVNPDEDLASVTVTWFGRNDWIQDLEMDRIPESASPASGVHAGRGQNGAGEES